MTNDGTYTYTYDLEGNVETKSKGTGLEKWYYAYDHDNRLLSVRKTSDGTTDTLTVTYAYDVFGNRAKEDKWSSGPGLVTTKFVYLGQEVYLDLNNANAVQMRYVQGDVADEMLAQVDGSNNVRWFLTDRLGSVRDIANASGTVINSLNYTAYGEISSETNSANRSRYAWVGQEIDYDFLIGFTPTRVTLIGQGRFAQTDSIWFQAGDPNLYRYAENNPTNLTDPSGLVAIGFAAPLAALGPLGWAILGGTAITGSAYLAWQYGKFPSIDLSWGYTAPTPPPIVAPISPVNPPITLPGDDARAAVLRSLLILQRYGLVDRRRRRRLLRRVRRGVSGSPTPRRCRDSRAARLRRW